MKRWILAWTLLLLAPGLAAAEDDGFTPLFDGLSLANWDGDAKFWNVRDGVITGQTTPANPTKGNTFLIWNGSDVADFELKLEYKIVGGNSGIQYRSFPLANGADRWRIGGYQADFEAGDRYSGICYGEQFRNILADRGEQTELVRQDGKFEKKVVGSVGNSEEIGRQVKKEDWNEYHIIAQGFHFVHKINGVTTCEVTDNDQEMRRASGLLALQLHQGPPMTVQFRNIRLKRLAPAANPASQSAAPRPSAKKKIVFVAGKRSHGYAAHEHYAGCVLLAKHLQDAIEGIQVEVVRDGWPADDSVFNNADCVVMYADGGGGHPVIPHLAKLDGLAEQGVGVVCLHYAVEVPAGEPGEHFLRWIGGYFEANWSVNPHWTAQFASFPDHPISRGVQPFEINDEWYYHMRFRDQMQGVTPILTSMPGPETLSRPDGPHSGNPHVRAAVLVRKEPQTVAWAAERPGGGRGFGFSGGHVHWNWGDPNFRKIVLNAIGWCAKIEIPAGGLAPGSVTLEQLEANQDFPQPPNFDRKGIEDRLPKVSANEPAPPRRARGNQRQPNELKPAGRAARGATAGKPIFSSPLVTAQTPGHAVAIDLDIRDAKKLFLVVTDGGNGFGCDWADWAEPVLVGASGEIKLTDLPWKSAQSAWGQTRVNQNADGGPLKINGQSVAFGIGTHAVSVIQFDLPAGGFQRFQARAGLDNGGTDQAGGAATSVQFHVFTTPPGADLLAQLNGGGNVRHESSAALEQLDIHPDLDAQLFAAEPTLFNPTNIDIDPLGRVWVCEVLNYRRFRNQDHPERTAGDRILVLEDANHDGTADTTQVFYQGRDIDSAHGICVLATPTGRDLRVIISANDSVFYLIDDDGDLRADRKELLFTGISGAQHDHGIHACVFGPDGKLYFNFGNEGKQLKDRQGQPIVDLAGNRVAEERQPYQQGMVFRCNLDGSEVETLGWNFRNNWEVAVDSFGTLWQSDNDDDGNQGVRINYVMEFGNYGYRDEITGGGWRDPRTGIEEEIPRRHWHLNDPGVVPNLLQTGAGSPTGMCVYEGALLPEVFRNQMIHCDAGPSIVRSYPVQSAGAGYAAEIVYILDGGKKNQWFRPADVCVAPDGSLFVADWYDPGVGGHRMQDVEHGRLFRVIPLDHDGRYAAPPADFSTTAGCVAALNSPNLATRSLAWRTLHAQGSAAESALLAQFTQPGDPRARARALWLLGKIPGRGEHYVQLAARDPHSDLRCVAVRLARQLKLDLIPLVTGLVRDPSPQVRRELAIALRHHSAPQAAELWAELAQQHDGQDRWYLEALGIGADRQWDRYLAAWQQRVGDQWSTPGGRDVVWRSRAAATPTLLAAIVADAATAVETHPRYLRAFDFLSGAEKASALQTILQMAGRPGANAALIVEALLRSGGVNVNANAALHSAVMTHLKTKQGSAEYVELVDQLNPDGVEHELLRLAMNQPADTAGVRAAASLLRRNQGDRLQAALLGADEAVALTAAQVLGNVGEPAALSLLEPLVGDAKATRALRAAAVAAVGRSVRGEQFLLKLVEGGQLPAELQFAAANALFDSTNDTVRQRAGKRLELPVAADSRPLPPVAELVKRGGDVHRGRQLFADKATCLKCHKVRGEGKEVGPDLSEIGSKLTREAMFLSILDPSAGISHNYETYLAELRNGNLVTGLLMSQTDDAVTIRNAEGIDRVIAKTELESLDKSPVSLMPADLQKTVSEQELVDVVEYLTTLKKS